MFGFRSAPSAHVTTWTVVYVSDALAARANPEVEIMLCALLIGALAIVVVVSQIAIVMCCHAQAPTVRDQYEH